MITPVYKEYSIDITKPLDPQMREIIRDFGSAGVSPSYAAAYLGITRQAVDAAVKRGALRAARVVEKRSKLPVTKMSAIMIDTASLDQYRELRRLNGGKVPYRARTL